jgi:GMP synthase (glutamine-hydrolysing)
MAKVLAVNNYPTSDRFERLEKCIEQSGATLSSVKWNDVTTSRFNSCDGVVLSGSPDMLSEPKTRTKFKREIDAILDSSVPILGICFGHQMIARAFGAEVIKDGLLFLGMVKTNVIESDPLFDGLRSPMTLLESRHEIVKSLPKDFCLLASSETSKVATMKHTRRPLYGVQFHPERYTKANPDGESVVRNFVRMLG